MKVSINKYGEVLIFRPAGKDAFFMTKSYIFDSLKKDDSIDLDCSKVKVLTPSWADEFISGIKNSYKNTINYLNTQNESVEASLKVILE